MADDRVITTRTKVFTPRRYRAVEQVTEEYIADQHPTFRHFLDHARRTLTLELSREVLADKVDAQRHEWREDGTYASPKHAIADLFPPRSFRRRFFCYLWDLDPEAESLATHARHIVTTERWRIFPEAPLPTLGRPYHHVEVHHEREQD